MFQTLLGYLNLTAIVGAAAFGAGVVFSQKVKDYIAGVPADLRKGLTDLEAAAIARAKQAQADVINRLHPGNLSAEPLQNPAPSLPSPPAAA